MKASFICLVLLALIASNAAAQSNPDPSGMGYIDTPQTIRRALLETEAVPLPPGRGPASGGRIFDSNVVPVGAATRSPAAKPSAGSKSAKQEQASRWSKSTAMLSRLKPKWLSGDDKPRRPATDPFAAASRGSRQALMGGQHPSQRPVQQAIAHRGSNSRNPIQRAGAPSGKARTNTGQPKRVASRQPGSRRPGLLDAGLIEAGLIEAVKGGVFGKKEKQSKPRSLAGRPPLAHGFVPQGVASKNLPACKLPPQELPGRRPAHLPSAMAAQPLPSLPMASAPQPAGARAAKPLPASKPMTRVREQLAGGRPRAVFVGDLPGAEQPSGGLALPSSAMPSGPMVFVNDREDAPSGDALPTPTPMPKPLTKPATQPKTETLASGPTGRLPLDEPLASSEASDQEPADAATKLVASAPFPTTKAKPSGATVFASDTEQPNDRARALLAEAHQLAAEAGSIEQYSEVLKRCRYTLAIDHSVQAAAYANRLAAWSLNRRGEALEKSGEHGDAEADFREALACDADCWRAEHNLGISEAQRGDFESALRRFNRTIDLNPEFAKAYSNRAALSVQQGDFAAALEDYQRAIDRDPDLAAAHIGRGRVCHLKGRLNEALRHLDAAQMLAPKDAGVASSLGDLLVDLGRYGRARDSYHRAIELDPNSSTAYRNLAWLQATCPSRQYRDGQAALANTAKAESLAKQADDITLDTRAAALAAVGRFDEALRVQQRAIEIAPETDKPAYRERLALYEQGEAITIQPTAEVQQASATVDTTRR